MISKLVIAIPNSGIGSVPIPEFRDYKNLSQHVLFGVLNDTNRPNNSSLLMNKIFDAH